MGKTTRPTQYRKTTLHEGSLIEDANNGYTILHTKLDITCKGNRKGSGSNIFLLAIMGFWWGRVAVILEGLNSGLGLFIG